MWIRQLIVFPAAALMIAAGLAAAEGVPPVDQLMQAVENRYNHAHTLTVDFKEIYSFQGHRRPAESGTLVLKKQGKMRWDYTQPAGKVFVSDGKNVYLYTAQDNRVEKVPLKDTEDMRAPLAFLLGRLDMKREFTGFTVHAGDGGVWLDALAKNDRVAYEKIEMLVAEQGEIRQLEVEGRDGSTLSYSFSNERLNPPVRDSTFHFSIPAGAQVVDSDALEQQGR
jgi:outer membrane lipoprotein carrier protein